MGKRLVVRFVIPIVDEDNPRAREPLIFHRWLPSKDEALTVKHSDMELRFWLDAQGSNSRVETDPEEIGRYINIKVGKITVDVEGIEVSPELGDLIARLAKETNFYEEHIEANYDSALLIEYRLLGEKTYSAVICIYNRIIAYIRAFKGQYWLREYKGWPTVLHSEFNRLRAKISIDGSDWVTSTTLIDSLHVRQ